MRLRLDVYKRQTLKTNYVWKLHENAEVQKEFFMKCPHCGTDVYKRQILQTAYKAKVTVDKDSVRDIAEFYRLWSGDDLYLLLKRNNLKKMLSYLKRLKEEHGGTAEIIARDYEDYLDQLERLNIPLDKHSRFPANFYHVHEELSEQIRELEDRVKKADIRKKNRILKKVIRQTAPLYDTESDSYMIIWPKSKKDFSREGDVYKRQFQYLPVV